MKFFGIIKEFIHKVEKVIRYLKPYQHYGVAILLAFIICTQSAIAGWWQHTVIDSVPIEYGWHTFVLLLLFCIWCIYKIITLHRRSIFSDRLMAVLLLFIILHVYYRFFDSDDTFNFVVIYGKVAYMDVLAILSLVFIIEGEANKRLLKYAGETECDSLLQQDSPIETPVEDRLQYYDRAFDIATRMSKLPRDKSQSIAILSPWGDGKTSFMNLIRYALKKGAENKKPIMESIIVEFNPRLSKTVNKIQEDFFATFSATLSKYDSNIPSSVERHLISLGMSSENPLLTTFLKLLSHNEDNTRERINYSLLHLPYRVIVFIDDFDRLMPEDMIEVFKLIDKNASFKNVIFVTAFDPDFVNKALGHHFGYSKNEFADKFFTLEYQLPIRPYTTIVDILYELLSTKTASTEIEKKSLKNLIFKNTYLFQLCIKNIRDVKRFYNQFIVDYVGVRDEVKLDEYIVVELIKYRYREDFDKLKDREYLNSPDLWGIGGFYVLKEECKNDNNIKSLPLLKYLFTDSVDGLDTRQNYKSIKRVIKFNTYFWNKLYNQIPDKDFRALFQMSMNEISDKIDVWKSMNLMNNVVDFVVHESWQFYKKSDGQPDWQTFSKFVKIVMLLAYKANGGDLNLLALIYQMLYKPNLKECNYYGKTYEEYKNFMIYSLYGDYSRFPFEVVANISMEMAKEPQREDEKRNHENQIINWATYQAQNLKYFKWYIHQNKDSLPNLLRIYQLCIKEILPNDKVIILDEANSIMREYIESDNQCSYLRDFIRYHIQDNAPYVSIQCEPFCKQIFCVTDDNDPFEEYVEKASIDEELRNNILTYWTIYKNNPYNEYPLYKHVKGTTPTLTEIIKALDEERKIKEA